MWNPGVVLCQKDREWETKPIFAPLVWTALSLNRCGILWQALAEFCPEVGCAGASMRVWLGATVCGCVSGEKRFSWEEFGRGEICPCLLFLSSVWAWAWPGLKICLGRGAIGAGPGCPAGRSVQGWTWVGPGHAEAVGDQTQRNTLALPVWIPVLAQNNRGNRLGAAASQAHVRAPRLP